MIAEKLTRRLSFEVRCLACKTPGLIDFGGSRVRYELCVTPAALPPSIITSVLIVTLPMDQSLSLPPSFQAPPGGQPHGLPVPVRGPNQQSAE
jgi:hypothetical protein